MFYIYSDMARILLGPALYSTIGMVIACIYSEHRFIGNAYILFPVNYLQWDIYCIDIVHTQNNLYL